MIRKIAVFITMALITVNTCMQTLAGQWKTDSVGWYYDDNGTSLKDQWQEINGKYYYFDKSGHMLHDTTTPDGYQVGSDGAWIEEIDVTEPTEYQKQIIEICVSPLIYGFDFYASGKTELKTESLTSDQMVSLLGWHINEQYGNQDQILFIPAGQMRYFPCFDKVSTIQRVSDLYGKKIDESGILNDSFVITQGNKISVIGADGEGWAVPHIVSYTVDGNHLTVSIFYTIEYNVEELNTSGSATAVFVSNKESFFGYNLESLKLN